MNRIEFDAPVERFGEQGEKTGWHYVHIPDVQAVLLHPGDKKSFRVKGTLDELAISGTALIPMGEGHYVLPINSQMRKALGCRAGHILKIKLEKDLSEKVLHLLLMECLQEAPEAEKAFLQLPPSHQKYYSKWVESARTEATQTKRIVACIKAMEEKLSFGEATKLK